MSRKIINGDVVTIAYVGKLTNGLSFTDSEEDGPIKFKVGKYEVVIHKVSDQNTDK